MNIELDEVVVQDVSDDALELAAGVAKGGNPTVGESCWPLSSNIDCPQGGKVQEFAIPSVVNGYC